MNEAESTNVKFCRVCEAPATKRCSRCEKVYYCDKPHQISDWNLHKKDCFIVKPDKNDPNYKKDPQYVAAKKIRVDEIIFYEKKPLLSCPRFSFNNPVVTCLNCYIPLKTIAESKQCLECGWYMCLNCTKHDGPECKLTLKYRKSKFSKRKYKSLWSPTNSDHSKMKLHQFCCVIIVLRALALQESDPEAYGVLMSLKIHADEFWETIKPPLMEYRDMATFVRKFLKKKSSVEAEFLKILKVVLTNGFLSKPHNHGTVFETISYLKHACRPNCILDIFEGRAIVSAVTEIAKNEKVTISYGLSGLSTEDRRRKLYQSEYFNCECDRCKDPTEFGTMFSAIKCNANYTCTGYVLPSTFLVPNGEEISNYICNTCGRPKTWMAIVRRKEYVYRSYIGVDPDDPFELRSYIYLIDSTTASVEELRENVKRCENMAYLFETLMPDEYRRRGTIQYKMYLCSSALATRLRRETREDFFENLDKRKEMLKEAKRLFRYEEDSARLVNDELEKLRKRIIYEQHLYRP